MKKIYSCNDLVSFDNGKTWKDTSFFESYKYLEESDIEIISFESEGLSFQEIVSAIENGNVKNAKVERSLFTNKQKIKISLADSFTTIYFTEKNYKTMCIKRELKECNSLTFKNLMNILTADEFCEYLKDRGINSYNIL